MPRFKDYFHFNRAERRGIITLLSLIFLIIIAKESLIYFNPEPIIQNADLDSLMAEIQNRIDEEDRLKQKELEKEIQMRSTDSRDFYNFNPNGFSVENWQTFGLSKKQAEVIKRYEASGGNFRTKKDVKKMFVISDKLYKKLEKYILLPDSMVYEKLKNKAVRAKPKKKYIVDINRADTTELKKLRGIGSVLSKRIVDYREALGGFYSKEQLEKVYGLKEEVLQRLDSQLLVGSIPLQKLNVNSASVEELRSHPLINWKLANAIVKYRQQHGNYEKIDDLSRIVLVKKEWLQEVRPYLEI